MREMAVARYLVGRIWRTASGERDLAAVPAIGELRHWRRGSQRSLLPASMERPPPPPRAACKRRPGSLATTIARRVNRDRLSTRTLAITAHSWHDCCRGPPFFLIPALTRG